MSDPTTTSSAAPSRRAVVSGLVGVGLGGPLLAACGSDDSAGGGSGGSGSSTTASGPIAKTSEVPVGGGKIFSSEKVVVTQPTKGDYKAFSAVCTHQQCLVTKITGEDIDCACHGSKFSIKDGSVVQGPASEPLETLEATVEGDQISVS